MNILYIYIYILCIYIYTRYIDMEYPQYYFDHAYMDEMPTEWGA